MADFHIISSSDSCYEIFFFGCITALLLHLLLKTYFQKLHTSTSISSVHALSSPPSPPSLPLIGHLHLITPVLVTSFQALSRRYGPLIHLRIGASSCVVASNSSVAKEILKTNESNFISRPEFGSSEHFIYRGSRFVMAQYGPYWRFMKKLTMTKLLSLPQLDVSAGIRRDEIENMVSRIEKSSREGKATDLSFETTTLTNSIICRMALNTRCSDGGDSEDTAEKIKDLVWSINRLAGKLSVGDVLGPFKVFDFSGNGKKFVEIMMRFDRLMERIMKEHEHKLTAMNDTNKLNENKDLLDILLEIYRDPNPNPTTADNIKLSRKDIKSFLLDIFMAGTDTTSTAIQWAMGELLNRPDSFQKLREEIISVVGIENDRLIKESDVPNLPYLRAVVKETLRLHPSAPLILRECSEDTNINGSLVKAKTRVIINAYAVMRDPESWSDPEKFMPERFLESSTEKIGDHLMDMKGRDSRYIPFGSGKRGCAGSSLALLVLPYAIGALVQRFDWKGKDGNDDITLDMKLGPGFAAEMATPLVARAHLVN